MFRRADPVLLNPRGGTLSRSFFLWRLILPHPLIESVDSGRNGGFRFPAGSVGKSANIGDEPRLIAGPPVGKGEVGFNSSYFVDQGDQLEKAEAVFRSAADVEGPAADLVHLLLGQLHRIEQVVDKKNVANLATIAVDRDRFSSHRLQEKMGDPTLILRSELVGSVDAAHPENGRGTIERSRIFENVLIGGSFRTSVRSLELERPRFADSVLPNSLIDRLVTFFLLLPGAVRKRSVNFVGRREKEGRRSFELPEGFD